MLNIAFTYHYGSEEYIKQPDKNEISNTWGKTLQHKDIFIKIC